MFPALSVVGDTQEFSVTIVDDSVVKMDEIFTLSSSDNNPRAQNLQPTALGIIGNDDIVATIGLLPLVFIEHESVDIFQACVQIISTTNNSPLNIAGQAFVSTEPNTAIGMAI